MPPPGPTPLQKTVQGWLTGCVMTPFLLIWVLVTLVFDALIGYGVWQQCRAWTYTGTAGVVESSQVLANPDDDSQQLAVRYRYAVDGREFHGGRYRYGMFGTNDRSWHRVQSELPPGTPVTVYYDPADPAEATLTRGPQGMDLFLANFLVPFNLIAVALPAYALRRKRPGFDPTDPKVVRRTAGGWELRLGARGG